MDVLFTYVWRVPILDYTQQTTNGIIVDLCTRAARATLLSPRSAVHLFVSGLRVHAKHVHNLHGPRMRSPVHQAYGLVSLFVWICSAHQRMITTLRIPSRPRKPLTGFAAQGRVVVSLSVAVCKSHGLACTSPCLP